jgi:hypothetical protein
MIAAVPLLVAGTIIAGYLGMRLRKIKAIEEETQARASAASENIKADLEAKRQRDELRRNWDNEHMLISDEAFVGFTHLSVNIGGTIVSCPKCKEL